MQFVKDSGVWSKLWSVWALILSPFLGYGVNELQRLVTEGPTTTLGYILLACLSVIGVFTRLVKQNLETPS